MVYVFSCPSVWKTPTDPPVPSSVIAHRQESTTPSRYSYPTVVLSQLYAGKINFPVLWIPGLLLPQARFFRQVSIQRKVKVKSLSLVWLFVTPCTVAHQAPPSMEFSRPEYWRGLPFPSPGDLPDPGGPGLITWVLVWQKFYYSEKERKLLTQTSEVVWRVPPLASVIKALNTLPDPLLSIHLKLTRLELTIERSYQTHSHICPQARYIVII